MRLMASDERPPEPAKPGREPLSAAGFNLGNDLLGFLAARFVCDRYRRATAGEFQGNSPTYAATSSGYKGCAT